MQQVGLWRVTYALLVVVLLLVAGVGMVQTVRWNIDVVSEVDTAVQGGDESVSNEPAPANAVGTASPLSVPTMAGAAAVVTPAVATVTVPILVYHGVRDTAPSEAADVRRFNVAPAELDRQLAFIQEQGYTPISFAMLARHFDTGTALPARPIIISFDDGTDSQYRNALPLLVKHGMSATFFVYPHALEYEHFMTWDELHQVTEAGMEIGSHSYTHQYMTRQDEDAWAAELAGSKVMLEERLGVPVTTFAYPFGLYDDRLVAAVHEAGYTTARGLDRGVRQSVTVRYMLRSYLISNDFADFTYILTVLGAGEVL